MKYLFACLGALVIVTSVAPLSRSPLWWIRGLDFPRMQIAVLGVFSLAGLAFTATSSVTDLALVLALLAVVVLQLAYILPFSPLMGKEVSDAVPAESRDCLSILIVNVLTSNRRAHELLEQIEAAVPDLVLTLETDLWWQQQLQPLEATYAHRCQCPQDNLYGMHLYSRLKLIEPEVRFLIEDDVPSIRSGVELPGGAVIQFYGLHPAPPSPTENKRSTERDGELLMVGRECCKQDRPVIVTGDLNDVAWSATTRLFRRISGLLDPRIGRGMYNSFHAKYRFLRWPLDHLFHSREFRLVKMRRLAYFGSDHFPIYVKLVYSLDLSGKQQPNGRQPNDHERAREKIEAATNVQP